MTWISYTPDQWAVVLAAYRFTTRDRRKKPPVRVVAAWWAEFSTVSTAAAFRVLDVTP